MALPSNMYTTIPYGGNEPWAMPWDQLNRATGQLQQDADLAESFQLAQANNATLLRDAFGRQGAGGMSDRHLNEYNKAVGEGAYPASPAPPTAPGGSANPTIYKDMDQFSQSVRAMVARTGMTPDAAKRFIIDDWGKKGIVLKPY